VRFQETGLCSEEELRAGNPGGHWRGKEAPATWVGSGLLQNAASWPMPVHLEGTALFQA
jgi:hypothetical protein